MDEKRRLQVIEKMKEELSKVTYEHVKSGFLHPNQTNPLKSNPIQRKMLDFHSKIGDKFSLKDLLR